MPKMAVVGAGLIGRAWSMVFARGGWDVALYDAIPAATEQALAVVAGGLAELQANGLAEDAAGRGQARADREFAWGRRARRRQLRPGEHAGNA
ncbi:MAG: 3-hydroxyacyl-CoA dehydrogenase NAD-binding domain-containing protein [Pseudolabrys sp.]